MSPDDESGMIYSYFDWQVRRRTRMRIGQNITELVGNTPMVKLNVLCDGLDATIALKLESHNPLGSVKDRIAVSMVDEAERQGEIKPAKQRLLNPHRGIRVSVLLS
jgi:cysteine synthase